MCGLTIFPDDVYLATACDDGTIRMWNTSTRKQEKIMRFDYDDKGEISKETGLRDISSSANVRAIAVSPGGDRLAIGFKDGSLQIIDIDKWEIINRNKESTGCISDIKFSPDTFSLLEDTVHLLIV